MRVARPLLASVLVVGLMGNGAASLSAAPVTPAAQISIVDKQECTIIGSPGDDVLVGTPGADVLCGRGGDDVIWGGDGDDVLRGGPGNDQLRGEGGDDLLRGGRAGSDDLDGGVGDDVLHGLKGPDLLNGGKGRDLVKGGDGPDEADGGPGRDTVQGGASADSLKGGKGSDRLEGGSGADRLDARDGSAFVDKLYCGPGVFDRARADVEDRVAFSCEEYPDNVGPTDLSLSKSTLSDGRPAGTKVGVLGAVDPNPGDELTFRLVEGAGAQDNQAFDIDGRRLMTREPTDAGTKKDYSIRVRVTDHWAARETKVFTISVDEAGQPPITPDEPPTAVDDSATVTEDDPATAVDVLANDLNVDGGKLAVDSVTQPADGTVAITGGGTGLTYRPDADYCNDGSPKDTFKYTLNGGSTATVAMTVTCVDDPAVAVDDAATVSEDAAATAVDVLANDDAGDTGPLVIDSVTQPGDGAVVITGGGSGLTYEPNPNYCNEGSPKDTFTYTLNGGSTATVSVRVTCVDDPPTAVGDSATVTEDAAASAVNVLANDTNGDGGPLSVESVTKPANGKVAITGGGSGLTYEPNANYCNDGSPKDTFTYTLNGGSTATVSMTVTCVDDPPTAVNDSTAVAEDAAATAVDVLANDTDPDGGELSIKSVTQPVDGTVVITGSGAGLTYQPAKDYCNGDLTKDTFKYTINGGSQATVSVRVVCADDPPTAVDDSATVTEDAAAADVNVLANDVNGDGGPLSVESVTQAANGTVVLTGNGSGLTYEPNANYCNDGSTKDTFTYTLNGGSTATVSMTVTCVDDPPKAVNDVATVTEDAAATAVNVLANDDNADGGPLSIVSVTQPADGTVAITGGGTGLSYRPDADYCNDGSPKDTFEYTINGGSKATVSMAVTCVNDPPTAVNDSGTTDEDTTLTVPAAGVLTNDTDKDQGDTKTVVKLNDSTTLTGTSAKGASVTIAADGGYTYNPGGIFQGLSTGESDTDSFTYTMADGAGAESTATVRLTITGVSDAPTANTDSFDAVGNTALFVSVSRPTGQAGRVTNGSVLANDTDPDSPAAALVVQDVTDAATTRGGRITIKSDGTFAYQPPAGDTGVTDSFTYRVCDASPCTATTVANSTGTLRLPIAGQVWYVDNTAPAGGGGTSTTPFDTLAEAEAASGAGDTTFVFDGNDTSTGLGGGYTMNNSERLIGEVSGLTLDPDGPGPLDTFDLYPATAGKRPVLTASGEDVVTLASKSTVSGLGLDPSGNGGGLSGGVGVDASTISDVTINDTGTNGTQPGLELNGTTGTTNVSNLSVSTAQAKGVRLANAGKVVFASSGTVSIVSNGAAGLDVSGTALTDSEFDSITVTGSGNGGVGLTNVVGPTKFTDLSLTTTSGTAPAFAMSNAGSVTVTGGNNTLAATPGTALEVANTTIGADGMTFRSISTNGASKGIVLDNTGSTAGLTVTGAGGTCTSGDTSGCSGGSILNSAGADDASSSPVGTGIVLKNTKTPSLTRMLIQDNSNYAIRGTDVSGFTLANSVIKGLNGTNGTTPFDDSAIRFVNLTGSAAITDTHVSGGREDNLSVTNSAGTLDRITLTRVSVGLNNGTDGNDAVHLESESTAGALKATIQNSTFTGARGDLVDYSHNGTGSGDLVISASTFQNNNPGIVTGGGGLTLSNSGTSGNTTMDITGNTFRDAVGIGVLVVKTAGSSVQTGTFSNNTIGVSGVQNSGSAEGSGLKLQNLGQGTMTWGVTNNQIRGYNENGIEVLAGGGATATSGNINTTITGNTIEQPGNTAGTAALPKNGIHFNVGTMPGDTFTACAVIGGSGGLANAISASGKEGLGAPGTDYDFRLRQRQATTIRLPGYAGPTNDNAAVVTFISGRNSTGGTPFGQALNTVPTGGGFTGTGCP